MIILLPFLCLTVSANELSSDTIEIPRENCFFDKDKFMIPFRILCESLGATVDWDSEQHIANAYYISESCEVDINVYMREKPRIDGIWDKETQTAVSSDTNGMVLNEYTDIPAGADMTAVINGEYYPVFFDTPAVIISGRLYIPSDVITETFGAVLIYDWHTIIIKFTEDNIFGMAQRETEKVEIIRLINEARVENGLKPLKYNITLDYISGIKIKDKAAYKYAGHTSPKLGTPAEMVANFTEKLKFTGECLYYCSIKVPSERVFNGWLDSPGHRAIIMSERAEYIGINMVIDDKGGVYWALLTAR
jgi:uncharacterized protein YkwD